MVAAVLLIDEQAPGIGAVGVVLFDFLPEPQHGPGKVISNYHYQGLADAWAKHDDHLLVLQPFNMKRDAARLDAVQFI
jgi:hypothetical protein